LTNYTEVSLIASWIPSVYSNLRTYTTFHVYIEVSIVYTYAGEVMGLSTKRVFKYW